MKKIVRIPNDFFIRWFVTSYFWHMVLSCLIFFSILLLFFPLRFSEIWLICLQIIIEITVLSVDISSLCLKWRLDRIELKFRRKESWFFFSFFFTSYSSDYSPFFFCFIFNLRLFRIHPIFFTRVLWLKFLQLPVMRKIFATLDGILNHLMTIHQDLWGFHHFFLLFIILVECDVGDEKNRSDSLWFSVNTSITLVFLPI